MSLQPSSSFVLQQGNQPIARPLPAEEQLAPLLRLVEAHSGPADEEPPHTPHTLTEAYACCQRIIREHSKSFFFSTQFLPYEKRQAVQALYAFCRITDDTVDQASDDPAHALATWVRQVRATPPPRHSPILIAWHDTRTRYNLPNTLVDELLAGVAMDLSINRYERFADLWLYCYRVASVVGLLSMGITGYHPGARPYAIKLGVALQLTNILRDIGEDAQRGRVYLPTEELARFGLSPEDILARTYDQRFIELMKFQVARANRLYEESWPGIALLPADSRLGVASAALIYRGILDKIAANRYDSYTRRAHLTLREKLLRLPSIWAGVRRIGRSRSK